MTMIYNGEHFQLREGEIERGGSERERERGEGEIFDILLEENRQDHIRAKMTSVTIQTLLLSDSLSFHNNESLHCKFKNTFYSYIHTHTTLSFHHSFMSIFSPKLLTIHIISTQQQA